MRNYDAWKLASPWDDAPMTCECEDFDSNDCDCLCDYGDYLYERMRDRKMEADLDEKSR